MQKRREHAAIRSSVLSGASIRYPYMPNTNSLYEHLHRPLARNIQEKTVTVIALAGSSRDRRGNNGQQQRHWDC